MNRPAGHKILKEGMLLFLVYKISFVGFIEDPKICTSNCSIKLSSGGTCQCIWSESLNEGYCHSCNPKASVSSHMTSRIGRSQDFCGQLAKATFTSQTLNWPKFYVFFFDNLVVGLKDRLIGRSILPSTSGAQLKSSYGLASRIDSKLIWTCDLGGGAL